MYYLIRAFLKLALKLYFRNYQVTGLQHLPKKGPVLIVANHPATFMDAIIIVATVKTRVYFTSKSTLFTSPLVKWIFARIGMIPVYRSQDGAGNAAKNAAMFETCFNYLKRGKTILVFPEGVSNGGRKLHEIKTGAARMVLGAEDRAGFTAGVQVVCIGLNYLEKGTFQSNVSVNIAQPIAVKTYAGQYAQNSHAAVKQLTRTIALTLHSLTVSINEKETDEFVSRIEKVYKPVLMRELNLDKKDKSNEVFLAQKIVDYLHYYRQYNPWRLHELKQKTDAYYAGLGAHQLEDAILRRVNNRRFLLWRFVGSMVYFIVGIPVFVYGFVFNILPYQLTALLSKKLSHEAEFRVAISLVGGLFIYTFVYAAYIAGALYLANSFWLNVALLVSFPLTGLFAYVYRNYLLRYRATWRTFLLMHQKTDVMRRLLTMRQNLICELQCSRHAADMQAEV